MFDYPSNHPIWAFYRFISICVMSFFVNLVMAKEFSLDDILRTAGLWGGLGVVEGGLKGMKVKADHKLAPPTDDKEE